MTNHPSPIPPNEPSAPNPGAVRTLVVFHLDERRFALHLAAVERVVPMVEIVPLPRAPAIVLGVINVEGRIIPVVDIRARFSMPPRPVAISDHLVIAHARRRSVALVADTVAGVTLTQEIISTERLLENATYIEGVAKLNGDLIFIHDLDTFLSASEAAALDAALEPHGAS
jgi:Chemotaxis signal transduction protein